MIAQLTGTVTAVGGTWVVLDLSGFGVRALCTPATVAALLPGARRRGSAAWTGSPMASLMASPM